MKKCKHDGELKVIGYFDAMEVEIISSKGKMSGPYYDEDLYDGEPNRVAAFCEKCDTRWTAKVFGGLPDFIKDRYDEAHE